MEQQSQSPPPAGRASKLLPNLSFTAHCAHLGHCIISAGTAAQHDAGPIDAAMNDFLGVEVADCRGYLHGCLHNAGQLWLSGRALWGGEEAPFYCILQRIWEACQTGQESSNKAKDSQAHSLRLQTLLSTRFSDTGVCCCLALAARGCCKVHAKLLHSGR